MSVGGGRGRRDGIFFKYKKSFKDNGVAIMESYPARFDRDAFSIDAMKENIWFEKNESGYQITFSSFAQENDFSLENKVYFVYNGGENGRAYKQLIVDGTITAIKNGLVTVQLNELKSEKEFFEKFASITIEENWEE